MLRIIIIICCAAVIESVRERGQYRRPYIRRRTPAPLPPYAQRVPTQSAYFTWNGIPARWEDTMPAEVYIYVKGPPSAWYRLTGFSNRAADGNKQLVVIGQGIFDPALHDNLAEGRMPPKVIATIPEGRVIMTDVFSERTVNKTTGKYEKIDQDTNGNSCCTIL